MSVLEGDIKKPGATGILGVAYFIHGQAGAARRANTAVPCKSSRSSGSAFGALLELVNMDDFMSLNESVDCLYEFRVNISLDSVDSYTYNDGQSFLIIVLLPILLFLGILGNTAFIFVVYRQTEMRTVTNWYLTNLAVADILFLLSAIVDKLWAYYLSPIPGDNGPHGHFGCIVLYLIADLTYFASLGFVTLVSFDRFLAVRRPQASKGRRGKRTPVKLCAGSWVLSLCVVACLIPSRDMFVKYCLMWPEEDKYQGFPSHMYVCQSRQEWVDYVSNVMQTVPFFLAFALNVFLYVNIIRGLDRSIQNLGSHGMSQDKNVTMRNQIARMLVVNGVVFFCCLFPFELIALFNVIRDIQKTNFIPAEWQGLFLEISRALSYVNSVANPLIYTLMSHRYRANFKMAFSFERCRGIVSQRGRKENDAAAANDSRSASHRCQTATRVEIL
ncbi:somatostatin receptor type 5-like [Acanthaster planci]|uniref:Somatostatin receptor type 5-like n=1 Tax=Acanthaster planci TaxID=133434 RepID=A0A8B7XIC8_ACAPL|nr:somatostatin receptor type 5-like [Acanthaster planci]